MEVNYPVDGEVTWWEADVKQLKGDFAKVHFHCDGYPDDVVEVSEIRACGGATLSKNLYVKHIMPLNDPKLRAWFQANGRVLDEVRQKSQLLGLLVEPTQRGSAQLKLIGSLKCLQTAKMLLELHIKHQASRVENFSALAPILLSTLSTAALCRSSRLPLDSLTSALEHAPSLLSPRAHPPTALQGEMQRIGNERAQLAQKLESEKEKLSLGCRLEFPIAREVIGLVVGKSGKNIIDTQKATGVDRVEVRCRTPRVGHLLTRRCPPPRSHQLAAASLVPSVLYSHATPRGRAGRPERPARDHCGSHPGVHRGGARPTRVRRRAGRREDGAGGLAHRPRGQEFQRDAGERPHTHTLSLTQLAHVALGVTPQRALGVALGVTHAW